LEKSSTQKIATETIASGSSVKIGLVIVILYSRTQVNFYFFADLGEVRYIPSSLNAVKYAWISWSRCV